MSAWSFRKARCAFLVGRTVAVAALIASILALSVSCRAAVTSPGQPTPESTSSIANLAIPPPSSTPTLETLAPAVTPNANYPNVVLITIDTLRADHLSSYGYFRKTSPNLDALAAEGARFTMSIAQFAQTNPSHASILTGTYAATHKVMVHGVDQVDLKVTTLAEAMRSRGYTTAGIYSWPSLDPQMSGFERGFSMYQAVYQPSPGQEANPDIWRRSEGRADRTTDAALNWLEANKSNPFFLWVHYQDPHYPYNPRAPFNTLFEPNCENCIEADWSTIDLIASGATLADRDVAHLVALYDGSIAFTDQEIGRLVDRLRALGLLDKTVTVVTADHGESFGENGRWFHPFVPYNSVLRLPVVLRYPPAVPAGKVVDSLVRSIDIVPSVLELVGAQIPAGVEGRSLLPVIAGSEAGGRTAITQTPDNLVTVLTTSDWKLILNHQKDQRELYNLKDDPNELRNLAASNTKQLAELEWQLQDWMESHGIRP